MKPSWLVEGERHIGLAEIPGREHSPVIAGWLSGLKAWWSDDETPWCGVFVAHCLRVSGRSLPKHWYRALAWADWGVPLSAPVKGCVVVFERKGGGHVGFVVGIDQSGRLMVLGGNQGNRVSVAPFDWARAIAFRWPAGIPVPSGEMAVIESTAASSTNEA